MVDEILKVNPVVVQRLSQVIEDDLHPDGADIPELYASPPRKGRPTTSKTLKRNKNAFEYSRSSSRGRGSRFHPAGDLVVDLVVKKRNPQLELSLVSTYPVHDFPFYYSH